MSHLVRTRAYFYIPGTFFCIMLLMGELEGRKGAWAYVEGGMGSLSQAIADSAKSLGTTILTEAVNIFPLRFERILRFY